MNYLPCKRCGYYHDDGTTDYCVPCIFILGNEKEKKKETQKPKDRQKGMIQSEIQCRNDRL